MRTCGVDIGARTIEIVVFDADRNNIGGHRIHESGPKPVRRAAELFNEFIAAEGLDAGTLSTIATGYGREGFTPAQRTVTEITCHAKGAFFLLPGTRTVIDIGGQDSKVIALAPDGAVRDFAMNDRCAAGTGRYLETVAKLLEISPEALGRLALRSTSRIDISSMCAVFAESEIIGLLAEERPVEGIAAGVHRAVAQRIVPMTARTGIEAPIVFTGGVAQNEGMKQALEAELGADITVPPVPQITGALGAALIAAGR